MNKKKSERAQNKKKRNSQFQLLRAQSWQSVFFLKNGRRWRREATREENEWKKIPVELNWTIVKPSVVHWKYSIFESGDSKFWHYMHGLSTTWWFSIWKNIHGIKCLTQHNTTVHNLKCKSFLHFVFVCRLPLCLPLPFFLFTSFVCHTIFTIAFSSCSWYILTRFVSSISFCESWQLFFLNLSFNSVVVNLIECVV